MKKTFIWFIKAFVSGTVVLGIATGFCLFYYNLPVHHTNETGVTDYFWDKNVITIRGTEGFSVSETDSEGFVNTFPDKKDKTDILVMGSSHAEGFNVNSDENFTYILNDNLKKNGYDKYAYSIGMSGHDLLRCFRNFENAVKKYKPAEYVVIETYKTDFSIDDWEKLNNNTYGFLPSYDSGLIHYLQKNTFFRLVYAQISNFLEKDNSVVSNDKEQQNINDGVSEEYIKSVDMVIYKISKIAQQNNCKVMIVYCPALDIDYYGNVVEEDRSDEHEVFVSACEKYCVEFVDMFVPYKEMYEEVKYLPTGFSNTAIGEGHTNKYGHKCIADEIYNRVITR